MWYPYKNLKAKAKQCAMTPNEYIFISIFGIFILTWYFIRIELNQRYGFKFDVRK